MHCTSDDATMLEVANRFYRGVEQQLLVVDLDDMAMSAPLVWEAPAHPDGSPAGDDEPRFPHVYGPVEVAAVRRVRGLVRHDDGTFVGYAAASPDEGWGRRA